VIVFGIIISPDLQVWVA